MGPKQRPDGRAQGLKRAWAQGAKGSKGHRDPKVLKGRGPGAGLEGLKVLGGPRVLQIGTGNMVAQGGVRSKPGENSNNVMIGVISYGSVWGTRGGKFISRVPPEALGIPTHPTTHKAKKMWVSGSRGADLRALPYVLITILA